MARQKRAEVDRYREQVSFARMTSGSNAVKSKPLLTGISSTPLVRFLPDDRVWLTSELLIACRET